MRAREVEVGYFSFGVRACLFTADEADTDAGLDCLVRGIVESDKRAALYGRVSWGKNGIDG